MGYIDNGFVAFFERPDIAPLFKPGEAAFYKGETRRRVGDASMQDAAITAYQTALKEGWDPRPATKGWSSSIFGRKRGRRPPRQSRTSWTLAYRRTPRKLLNTRSGSRSLRFDPIFVSIAP